MRRLSKKMNHQYFIDGKFVIPTMEEVFSKPEIAWHLDDLSCNDNMTMEAKERIDNGALPNSKGEWSWYGLSSTMPMADIIANPTLPWKKDCISDNPDFDASLMSDPFFASLEGEWDMINIKYWSDQREKK